MDKYEAQLFTRFCSFVGYVHLVTPQPFIFDGHQHVKSDVDALRLFEFNQLDKAGLITQSSFGYNFGGFESPLVVGLGQKNIRVQCGAPTKKNLPVGNVLLTDAGMALCRITTAKFASGYEQLIADGWKKDGFEVEIVDVSSDTDV